MKKKIFGLLFASFLFVSSALADTYTVVKGDSLYEISRKYDVTIEQLKQANNLKSNLLNVGQELTIPGRNDGNSEQNSEETESTTDQKEQESSRSLSLLFSRVTKVVTPLVGIPYRYGGTSPKGFDCSGFTSYVMDKLGIKLPRVSGDQFKVGKKVSREDLQVGDLMFFDTYKKGRITHVGIYIGKNKMVHSASRQVEISNLDWYFANYKYYGAKRVLGE